MNCKIIATYVGHRRSNTPAGTRILLEEVVRLERTIDKGVDADTVIVNHDVVPHVRAPEKLAASRAFLESVDGTSTLNGRLVVLHRPWDHGVGGSFRSFGWAYERLRDRYEHWFFTEDDYVQIEPGYLRNAIRQLDRDPSVAFVGCARIPPVLGVKVAPRGRMHPAPFCHGGCGVTHRDYLDLIVERRGHLPFFAEPMPTAMEEELLSGRRSFKSPESWRWYRGFEKRGELDFTHVFVEEGFYLEEYRTEVRSNGLMLGDQELQGRMREVWDRRFPKSVRIMDLGRDGSFVGGAY